jgi:hypothetical protein
LLIERDFIVGSYAMRKLVDSHDVSAEMCRQCPVVAQCRAHALAVGEPYGIWGGLSESERELLLKRGIRRAS